LSRLVIYPGTFDPVTNGHLDILRRGLVAFDRVEDALAENVRKKHLFTVEERREMITRAMNDDPRVEVDAFEGLLVEYARRRGAHIILRGLRAVADFEYEFQFSHMNRRLAPEIHSFFMMTSEENSYISSSLIKEVASFGGDVSKFVPEHVNTMLKAKLAQQ
jgi:pantetheine-phosphate adenylyltransferase